MPGQSVTAVPSLVVGGGVGGLSAALAIAETGRPVHLIEQARSFEEIGAGIQLAPNALRVLRRLGVLDLAMKDAWVPQRAVLRSAVTGDELMRMEFGEEFLRRYGEPYIVIHRSDLLNALLERCLQEPLITLENDKTAVEATEGKDGAVVRCQDGTSYAAPLVVGADGLWSVLRQYVVGDGEPVCNGDVAYRGAIASADMPEQADPSSVTWWVGPDIHLIQYPVRRGELYNQVGVFTSKRFRPGVDPQSYEWGTADELDEHFANTYPMVRESALLLNRDRHWTLFDRDPVATWTRGHLTLVGDAAHPMLQYLAQGACQALEDAVMLGDCLQASGGDVTTAISRYVDARTTHTRKVQHRARVVGEIVHGHETVSLLRDEVLKGVGPTDYRLVDWLYGNGMGPLA